MRSRDSILAEITSTEARLASLRQELARAETDGPQPQIPTPAGQDPNQDMSDDELRKALWPWPLPADDYRRYGRQMIMAEVGLTGQLNVRKSAILMIGVGGLGCPAAAYLAGAGIKRLGLVDGDVVEVSNLHRQILHTTERIGMPKVHSAVAALHQLNPKVRYEPHASHLTPQTALDLFARYDLILDCTDHPTSRYLISDAAVLAGKPLVSASALKTDGQLVVLNYPPTPPVVAENDIHMADTPDDSDSPAQPSAGGPCYRCIFPKPPPPDSLVSCGEGGILGPVVGTMGVLMALEALKIITAKAPPPLDPSSSDPTTLLIFSAYTTPQFRSMRMKGKRADCIACGPRRSITAASLNSGSLDYIAFCGVTNPVRVLEDDERISPAALVQAQLGIDMSSTPAFGGKGRVDRKPTIIDVRDRTQFELAHLPGAINIPYSRFESGQVRTNLAASRAIRLGEAMSAPKIPEDGSPLVVVCRLGNDSQVAARKLKLYGYDADGSRWIGDLKGGLRAWRSEVEPDWPDY